jgi:iron complex outermembrane recepter protein
MRTTIQLLCLMLTLGAAPLASGQSAPGAPTDLALASLEDLMNIEITSASRKEQRAEDVSAAVYVITHEDIRRSGMTTVPDLLRLVPGVQVAQINANKWAVSVRGFNSLYSTKLLVLVDGRSIYNPLFSTVLWDTEDLMLDDIDRIEVIRGPGASVWGANAVNGVINILTRHSSDTRGLLAQAGADTLAGSSAAVRYGGAAGTGTYRVYTQMSSHGDSTFTSGGTANDHWRSATSGFRGDWASGANATQLQGSVTLGEQRPLWISLEPSVAPGTPSAIVSETQGGDVLGRWTHARDSGASLQLQTFLDVAHRKEAIGEYHRQTVDLDTTYHATPHRRHDVVIGGGYRFIAEAMDGGNGYSYTPDRARETLLNAFAQDEIAMANRRVGLTLGAKLENDTFAGTSFQPTARVRWNVTPSQRIWAGVSRALRTPSLIDRGLSVQFPPVTQPDGMSLVYVTIGNPKVDDEQLLDAEAGYRLDINARAAIDVAGFVGRYDGLMTYEPQSPTVSLLRGLPRVTVVTQFTNTLQATTSGVELAGRVRLTDAWQIDGALSTFHLTGDASASHDPNAASYDGHAPAYQWRGHSAFSLGPRAQADVLLFYVGALGQVGTPAYTRADARVEWKLTRQLSAVAQGQNLFNRVHAEFNGNDTNIIATQVPRSAGLHLAWRF